MTLTFSPAAAVFDASIGGVRVLALDGQRLVHCAIHRRALARMQPLPARCDSQRVVEAYRQNAERLQAIAAWKYENGQRDSQGRVFVDAEDLAGLGAPLCLAN